MGSVWKFSPQYGGGGEQLNFDVPTKIYSVIVLTFISLAYAVPTGGKLFDFTYFCAYIHLGFKHTVLDPHISYLGCLVVS